MATLFYTASNQFHALIKLYPPIRRVNAILDYFSTDPSRHLNSRQPVKIYKRAYKTSTARSQGHVRLNFRKCW